VVLGLVVLLLALGAGAVIAGHRARPVPDGAVLRVGDSVVTEEQFATRASLLAVLYRVVPPTDPIGLKGYRAAVVKAVALSTVLDQQARAKGITVSDRDAAQRLDDLITTSFPDGQGAFAARLASAGLTERDLLAEVRRQLATAQLFDRVTSEVPAPADGDVAAAARRLGQPSDERLRMVLRTERRQDVWTRWLDDTLRAARVRYAAAYQPSARDARPSAPDAPTR
jgi:peptidyl-prolyl cis-trans isomerase C